MQIFQDRGLDVKSFELPQLEIFWHRDARRDFRWKTAGVEIEGNDLLFENLMHSRVLFLPRHFHPIPIISL